MTLLYLITSLLVVTSENLIPEKTYRILLGIIIFCYGIVRGVKVYNQFFRDTNES